MAMDRIAACFVLLCACTAVLGDPAPQSNCQEATKCTISNVDITPCTNPKRCRFRHGVNASINFDILPQFSASELETDLTYKDAPFPGLGRDACQYTSCPTQQGVTQSLSYGLYINKRLPKGDFQIKWKIWNKADTSELCCFQTLIKIVK